MTTIMQFTAFQNAIKINKGWLNVLIVISHQSNPLPEMTEKVKCANIECNFFVIHCECKRVIFEAFEGVTFIDCSCDFLW